MTRFYAKLRRRDFIKEGAVAAAGSLVCGSGILRGTTALAQQAARASHSDDSDRAKPIIGTGWHGHTFPGAVAPFGMVQLSPDTNGPPEALWNSKSDSTDWDHCSGYHYADNVITGFTHTHLQGTGGSDLGDVLLMPMVESRNWSWSRGTPGGQAQAQAEALGTVPAGCSTKKTRQAIFPGSRMIAKSRAPATTPCISTRPTCTSSSPRLHAAACTATRGPEARANAA